MVTAKIITQRFDIPRSTLYRLVADGDIPAHDVTKSWHRQRQLRFKVSEVQQALEDRKQRPAPPD